MMSRSREPSAHLSLGTALSPKATGWGPVAWRNSRPNDQFRRKDNDLITRSGPPRTLGGCSVHGRSTSKRCVVVGAVHAIAGSEGSHLLPVPMGMAGAEPGDAGHGQG